jgi:transposase
MAERRERRTFSEEFKKQMVQLYHAGKPRTEIVREYDLSASAFDRWVRRINQTGSSKEAANRSPEEQELIKLRKENQQLRMENDVLKQAALIFAQKSK